MLSSSSALPDADQMDFETDLSQLETTALLVKLNGITAQKEDRLWGMFCSTSVKNLRCCVLFCYHSLIRFIIKICIILLLVDSLKPKQILFLTGGEIKREAREILLVSEYSTQSAADPHCTRFVLLTIK